MSGDTEGGFRYDQPSGGYPTTGTGRPCGCTIHDTDVSNPLEFFPSAGGDGGTYNLRGVCLPG